MTDWTEHIEDSSSAWFGMRNGDFYGNVLANVVANLFWVIILVPLLLLLISAYRKG